MSGPGPHVRTVDRPPIEGHDAMRQANRAHLFRFIDYLDLSAVELAGLVAHGRVDALTDDAVYAEVSRR